MSVKAIAYYLPQFHEIPENNKWWGKGFTEWTNLKRAKALFPGHEILKPLNNNYYNLLDKETVIWQTNLAKEYGVYGFNYYHYWFKGKKLLEKPAENFLKWKDIDHNFMFMWVNHDWSKSWVGGSEILIKQEYGNEEDWLEHINYLMPFFKDTRYIRINNKPVINIYRRSKIAEFESMVEVWIRECKNNGFDGIYIVDHQQYSDYRRKNNLNYCSAVSFRQHGCALDNHYSKQSYLYKKIDRIKNKYIKIKTNTNLRFYDYSLVINNALDFMKETSKDYETFFQVTTGWDNTPRYGKNGYLINNASPEKFKYYLKETKQLAESSNYKFIFLLCWNEWCEGFILEPTQKEQYSYLEAVKEVMED